MIPPCALARRVLVVGERHTWSRDPALALRPDAPGSGRRLWLLSGLRLEAYLAAFALANAADLRAETFWPVGGRVVLLGRTVARWAGVGARPYFAPFAQRGCAVWVLPHPSGRCRLYNDPAVRARAGAALREAAGLCGSPKIVQKFSSTALQQPQAAIWRVVPAPNRGAKFGKRTDVMNKLLPKTAKVLARKAAAKAAEAPVMTANEAETHTLPTAPVEPQTKTQHDVATKGRKPTKAERQAKLKAVTLPSDEQVADHFAAQQEADRTEATVGDDLPQGAPDIVDVAMAKGVSPSDLAALSEGKKPGEVLAALVAMPNRAEALPDLNSPEATAAALAAADIPAPTPTDEPEMFATYADAIKSAEARGLKGFHIIRTDGGYTMAQKDPAPAKGKGKTDKPAPTWPVHAKRYVKKSEAVADAKSVFGKDAQEKVDFVVTKLARPDETGGVFYWVAMAQVDAEWGNRQRMDHGLKPVKSTPRAQTKNVAPAPAKSGKAKGAAKAVDGEKKPKAGTNAEVIYAHLTRAQGTTKAEVEAALAKKHGKAVSCGIKTDAAIYASRYGMAVSESKDADGSARYRIA